MNVAYCRYLFDDNTRLTWAVFDHTCFKMHSLYLVTACLFIRNYGLCQNIDGQQKTTQPVVYVNTSAAYHILTGSASRIRAPTVNPPLQTTGVPISNAEPTPQVSNRIVVSPTQHYPSSPTESSHFITDPSRENIYVSPLYRAGEPQEPGIGEDIIERTKLPPTTSMMKPPSTPFKNTFPPKTRTEARHTVSKQRPTTRTEPRLITKNLSKNSTSTRRNNKPTSSTPCSKYDGTYLELVFENNSQEPCMKQMEEIQEGIIKYANVQGLDFPAHSVIVLNQCKICGTQFKNDTITLEFCIKNEKRCDVDATKNAWRKMDERTERKKLDKYIPVTIISIELQTPIEKKKKKEVNIPMLVGLLSVAFLMLILGVFIFRGKVKKKPVKDRFYFDGSKIQECLELATDGIVNESYGLEKVKDRQLKHMSLLVPAINLGLDIDEENKPDNELPSHLLSVNALKMYFTYKEAIDEEFKSLPYFRPLLKDLPVGVGAKNRTAQVLPPLDTRIILSSRMECNGYINANHVKGYQSSNVAYIATQAPLSNTCADFWHMVWEQQSRVIVMLCTPDEIGKNLLQYWPKNRGMEGALLFGDILVSLEEVTSTEHHTVSNLVVKDIEKNLCRPVCHYWFSSWCTQGVPSSPADITGLLLHIRESTTENQGPMVVHCSDGAGRTGALIAIDISMRELEDTTHVDVPRTTCMVRRARGSGVENALQYNYIYQALYDYSQRLSRANQQPAGW
ncbi:uncharacterized protein LOC117120814 [Anneissia japonica]|uniref:uncharacterized protein LOC117120814 n=1 Tax=Anneissia japonica TaxID=1529436 RepID=UPI0014258890|nr:uncharacterized protein LOC117120814 [Anneissia japonica]